MPCNDEWLLHVLVTKGILDDSTATEIRKSNAAYASKEILRRKLASLEQMAAAAKERYNVSFADPLPGSADKMAISLVPERVCRQHLLVPIHLEGNDIHLLMANPIDTTTLDELAVITARAPVPHFGLPDKIDELITEWYSSDSTIFDLLKKLPEEESVQNIQYSIERDPLESISIGTPLIRLANLLIAQAVRMLASDIHIEHDQKMSLVRYRIDGVLRNMMRIPKHIGDGPLVSRIKIMANLDMAERRKPQDGRAKVLIGQDEIVLRVSTMPTSFGEKVVIRILDQRQAEVTLDKLGYGPEILGRLTQLSKLEQGLLLVTGPTGSGKTTTLYSILNALKSEDINIVTVEDPIEYRLSGINQIQVNEKSGLGFSTVLRSILRQDPDVILVGEIRDRETADIAFQAALTGHMVFSTLHTNDALAAVSRLLDMGVERYKMTPALVGVTSQRLVRRICRACKTEIAPDPAVAPLLRTAGLPERQFHGKGCDRCGFTGLSGRLAITELLDLSDRRARETLNATHDVKTFRDGALSKGWLMTMKQDSLRHLSNGDTLLEDVQPYLEIVVEMSPEKPATAAPAPAPTPAAAAPSAPARSILVADDDANSRLLIKASLQAEGYLFSEAGNGVIALQEVAQNKPDLLILDLMMPEMDGFAVITRLRNEMRRADLPVLVLSALSDADTKAMALDIGADDYLTKPFDFEILRARVKALFHRGAVAAEAAPSQHTPL